jgi:hypothetical protein
MLTRLAKQLNVSEPANVNPAYFLVLEAFENLVNLLDSASLNGMCVIVDQLYNRFVTELLGGTTSVAGTVPGCWYRNFCITS